MKTHQIVIGVFTFFVALFLFSYVAFGQAKARAVQVSYSGDALITQSIKAKFAIDKDAGGTVINVKTINGAVMLSGFAKSDDEKSAAEGVAHKIRGVKSVKNDVMVRP